MEENKTVDIDQQTLYSLAVATGIMSRAMSDFDAELFESKHELSVPGLLVCTFLLDRKVQGAMFNVAWGTFLDVSCHRAILVNTSKQVSWPAWDESTLAHPELLPINDLCIMLSAWNFAAKQDELPPEMFLGSLFFLAGIISEGVERGYTLADEHMKKLYQEQRSILASSHGSEEEFRQALQNQLHSIDEALQSHRHLGQNGTD